MSSNDQPAQARAAAEPEQTSSFNTIWGFVRQALIFYLISQMISKFMPQSSTAPKEPAPVAVKDGKPIDPFLLPPVKALPLWPMGEHLDIHVHLTTYPVGSNFEKNRRSEDQGLPQFVWKNITLGDYKDSRVQEYTINFPKSVLNNGSLYADIFLTRNSASPNSRDRSFDFENVHHVRKVISPHLTKLKARREVNLLSGNASALAELPEEPDVIVPHWHTNITLAIISDPAVLPYQTLPPPIAEHIYLTEDRDETGTQGFYKPILFPNEFWHLRTHYTPINETTPSLPLQITFQPMSFLKFQMFASMTHGFKEAAKQQGGTGVAEMDEMKRMLLETNPWFLALTGLVSLLHVVFEMLAFKSDVSHWRQKKEMVGVSVRTIITNVFVQLVVLLYLIDNNDNTSWMILLGSGMGVVVEAWKITKAVDISLVPASPGSVIPYRVEVKDKHVLSEDEKKTQEYDKLAFRYVSYVAIPTLAIYTGYSLMYESHKGWYSFVISTLTSYVYMFGFAQLVPQLIINYKLKSVAHMPLKAMIYKTLSTVVDDLFAFCIKMPFLHRLACFRDDVVFLVFLYQRWIYRIDHSRVNEFGQIGEDVDKTKEEETKKKQ